MYKIFFLICFLIFFSCDLPNEANKDCNDMQNGLAELDECGMCVGGATGQEPCIPDCSNSSSAIFIS